MAKTELQMSPQLEQIHGEIRDNFRALANGFQKLDKIKDSNRQSKQLEELAGKMRECKRLLKEFDREIKDEETRNPPEVHKQLNDEKQSMIKELNSYVTLRKTYMSSLGNKRVELFDMGGGASDPTADDNVQVASAMSNQELVNAGMRTMDETDHAIERSKQVVGQTIEVGTQTAVTLKGQTDQMGRIVNELDTIQFSIKKASQLVTEIDCESQQQKHQGHPRIGSSSSHNKETIVSEKSGKFQVKFSSEVCRSHVVGRDRKGKGSYKASNRFVMVIDETGGELHLFSNSF
ncbi:hypothetical protein RHGRI_012816 [Rhododendron griersonianum]|uniref:t-SNARE coiled-coil homology domain-containing protein n=1 Tax=Rhododendron griersonianum TaxID=479676 RepID=A0AAV6KTF2_9ERIC|nr:hypothetical protein RHGRI_012816 [Rhododendron griersonianum]